MTKLAMCGPGLLVCDAGDFGLEEKYDGWVVRGGLMLLLVAACWFLDRSAEAKSSRVVEGVQLTTAASRPNVFLAACGAGETLGK